MVNVLKMMLKRESAEEVAPRLLPTLFVSSFIRDVFYTNVFFFYLFSVCADVVWQHRLRSQWRWPLQIISWSRRTLLPVQDFSTKRNLQKRLSWDHRKILSLLERTKFRGSRVSALDPIGELTTPQAY